MDPRFVIIILNVFLKNCDGSYNEQYRVPDSSSDLSESFMFEDREYIIQNLPVTWDNAKILCRGQYNGTLANVDTPDKAEFLAEAMSESQFLLQSLWLGARRMSSDDPYGYRWMETGVSLRRTAADIYFEGRSREFYPNWLNRTRVPVPPDGADCVAFDRIEHDIPVFADLSCNLQRPFVCEKEATSHRKVVERHSVRCASGLYRIYDGQLTWDQAAAYCLLRKMTLASLSTTKCVKKIGMSMLKIRPSIENAWIGARGELGKWLWVDTRVSIFTPAVVQADDVWPPLRDLKPMKQNGCLQLDRHSRHSPVFIEARCERKLQFICQETVKTHPPKPTAPPSDDKYNYILVRSLLFWQHAYENCMKMNGVLAPIESYDMMVQLMLVMGESKEQPVDHIWISGRLNMSKDEISEITKYNWYNPANGRRIPDKNTLPDEAAGVYSPPWLDEEHNIDNSCLNFDRQNHLTGLVYGLPCDTPQYSICLIEKVTLTHKPITESTIINEM